MCDELRRLQPDLYKQRRGLLMLVQYWLYFGQQRQHVQPRRLRRLCCTHQRSSWHVHIQPRERQHVPADMQHGLHCVWYEQL